MFSFNSLHFIHVLIKFNCVCMVACREVMSLSYNKRLVSSAYIVNRNLLLAFIISLIYIRKRIGPITDPCGTPLDMGIKCGHVIARDRLRSIT